MTKVELTQPESATAVRFRWLLICAGLLLAAIAISSVLSGEGSGTIRIKASGFQFSETEIQVRAGEPVTLELFNTDAYPHSFDIDIYDVHIDLPGSKIVEVQFTADEPGIYEFYCGASGHRQSGMIGKIIVEP